MRNSTEGMIDYLAERGEFSLRKFSDGSWHASIEIPAPKGCTAKVASDFKHPTHYEALRCVIERLARRSIVSDGRSLLYKSEFTFMLTFFPE